MAKPVNKMLPLIGRVFFITVSCVIVVVAGGGMVFIRRPVGAIYIVLWVVWWIVTMLGRQRGTPSTYDRSQWVLLIISGIVAVPLLIVAPSWEYAHFTGPIPRNGPLAWIGLMLFAAGIILQSAAMWTLRGFYTVRLGVKSGQRLVTTGPYHRVRHPGYLSYIISILGIGLALSSLIVLGLIIPVVLFIVWRIKSEEEMLKSEFGEEYQAYQQQTRRLLPFIY